MSIVSWGEKEGGLSSLRSLWTTCISEWRCCTARVSSLKILFTKVGVNNPLFLLAKSNKSPPGENCSANRHFSGNSLYANNRVILGCETFFRISSSLLADEVIRSAGASSVESKLTTLMARRSGSGGSS